jgi:hypothetical protein
MKRDKLREQRACIRDYYAMMLGAYAALPEAKKKEVHEWDRTHVDGHSVATSDWPGWAKYIGKMPKYPMTITSFKEMIPPEIRWQVWERDNFTCKHCGMRRDLTVDHIFPERLGGTLILANLQTLCGKCNSRKGTKVDFTISSAVGAISL